MELALYYPMYPEPQDNGGAGERCHRTATNWSDMSGGRWLIPSAAGILFLPLCSLSAERCITHFTIIYRGSHIRMNTVSVSLHMFHTSRWPLGCSLSLFLIKCLSVLKSNIKWFSKPIYYCWRSWTKACFLCSYTPMSSSNNLHTKEHQKRWRGRRTEPKRCHQCDSAPCLSWIFM